MKVWKIPRYLSRGNSLGGQYQRSFFFPVATEIPLRKFRKPTLLHMAICPAGDLHHLSLELETKYNSLSIFPGIYSSTLSSRKGAAGNLLSSTPSFPNGALLQTLL